MNVLWELLITPRPLVAWAAFFGMIAHLAINQDKLSRKVVVTAVFVNYTSAMFMADLVGELLAVKWLPGVAFVISAFGWVFVQKLVRAMFKRIGSSFNGLSNNDDNDQLGTDGELLN